VIVILTDSGRQPYDVSNDVMEFSILRISIDDISETACPIDFLIYSMVRFAGTAVRADLFPVGSDSRWRNSRRLV